LEKPFAPYKGAGPYVFVSYAHRNQRTVMRELGWLKENAIDFWYDEGIYAGADWRDVIGDAVKSSAICLFFVSKQSVQSDHCVREVKFALDNEIPVLPVYLEPVELPTGLALALSNIQAIFKFSLSTDRYEALTIEALREALGRQGDGVTSHRQPYGAIAVVAALAAVVVGIAYFVTWERSTAPMATGELVSIAVASFRQPSGEVPGGVAEALTVAVTNALVSAGNVRVVPLDSARRLRNQTDTDFAATFSASHLVLGNVQSNGSQLQVDVALVPRETNVAIWTEEFRGSQGDLFDLYDRVARGVIDAASDRLALAELGKQVRHSTNPLAYGFFLEAVDLDKRFPDENLRSIRLLEQAVGLEPGFVDARVELAFAYWRTNSMARVKKERVKATLNDALALEPRHGAARALLGTIVARCDYEWSKGFELLRGAHEDHPFDARVQALWAHHLGSIHHPDAPQASLVAYQLDPLSGQAVDDYARSLFAQGRQLDALRVRQNYLEMTAHEQTRDADSIEMLITIGQSAAAKRQLEMLESKVGTTHPDMRFLRMKLALQHQDLPTVTKIEAELLERSANEEVRFDAGSNATRAERIQQAIEQRNPQIIFPLLARKPPDLASSDWKRFREMVKADDVRTPVVVNYRERSQAEVDQLVASELRVEPEWLANITGVYASDEFPELTFAARNSRLVLLPTRIGEGVELRLIQTAPSVFEVMAIKGYRYEFGDGSLVAYDGQIRRDYTKRQSTRM